MKIAAYCRVSTEKEAQIDSLEKQIEFFNEFTKKNGYELYKLYADEGISGKQIKHRKQFQAMMQDAKAHKYERVVVKDVSRFARNRVDLLQSIRELKSYGIQVDFLNNGEVMEGGSEFILTILGAMAQQESANMSKRVKFGKDITAKKGRVPNLVFGYDKIPDEKYILKINEEEAKIVKKIFQMYNKGKTMGEIASKLQDDEIYAPSYNGFEKNKNGKYGWTYSTISKILKNKVYLGHTEYGKVMNLSYKSKKVKQIPRSEWKIAHNTHKAIIEQEVFDTAQKIIALNQRAKSHTHKWILNGIVYCKECGEPMQLKVKYRKDGSTISFMRLYCSSSLHKKGYCSRKYKGIELQSVTQIVVSNLNKKINNIVNCADLSEIMKNGYKKRDTNQYEKELKTSEKQLDKTNRIISSLYQDYKSGIIQEYDFKTMYDNETATREKLIEKINDLKYKISNKSQISNSEFKRIAKNISDVKKWTKEQLSDVIESVEIDNEDNIYINYKYDIMEYV